MSGSTGEPSKGRRSKAERYLLDQPLPVTDPGYAVFESRWLFELAGAVRVERVPDFITRFRERVSQIRAGLDRADRKAVFDAIQLLGLSAIEPDEFQGRFIDDYADIRVATWRQIKEWYSLARIGRTDAERQGASNQLKKLGVALAGDRRGQSGGAVPDNVVWYRYHQTLFRIERARHLLKTWPGARSARDSALSDVAKICGIPEEYIAPPRDGESGRFRRRLTAEQFAVIDTAREFNIVAQTVQNRLSKAHRQDFNLGRIPIPWGAALRRPTGDS